MYAVIPIAWVIANICVVCRTTRSTKCGILSLIRSRANLCSLKENRSLLQSTSIYTMQSFVKNMILALLRGAKRCCERVNDY